MTFLPAFYGTRERKDLQQPEPQRSVSALTARYCSLLCPVISCLMWLGCTLATFSVEILQIPEPLQGQQIHLLRQCIPWAVVLVWVGKDPFGPLQSHGMKEMGKSGPKWLSTG